MERKVIMDKLIGSLIGNCMSYIKDLNAFKAKGTTLFNAYIDLLNETTILDESKIQFEEFQLCSIMAAIESSIDHITRVNKDETLGNLLDTLKENKCKNTSNSIN